MDRLTRTIVILGAVGLGLLVLVVVLGVLVAGLRSG
jgi:hypothetical protein